MKRLLREWNKDNFWVYILSFSAITLFIVLILGTYLYVYYYKTIYRDFMDSNEEYLSAVETQHESDMLMLNDIMTQLSLGGGETEFILKDQPQKNFELRNMLYRYSSVSRFFDRIFFFYHEDEYLYNPKTSVSIDYFLRKGVSLEDCEEKDFRRLLYREESGMMVLPEQKIDGYLIKKSGEVIEKAVSYFITVEPRRKSTILFLVGEKYYNALLDSETLDMRQTEIWYKGQKIISRGDVQIGEDWNRYIQGDESCGQREVRYQHHEYLLSWKTGKSGLVYCTLQPERIFQNKIIKGQWGILLVLVVCSIPTSFVFWILAHRLSGRVRNIGVLLGAKETYDFNHLENGVRVLLEHRNENDEQTLLLRRTRFVTDYVHGGFQSQQEMLKAAMDAKLEVDRPYYAITLMGNHENSNENEAHKVMLHAIGERHGVDGYGIHLILTNQNLFVLFGNSIQELEAALSELFVIGRNCCEEFVMSVSELHRDFLKASDAYLEADFAYGSRLLVDNDQIIYYKNVKTQDHMVVLPDIYLQRLKNAIRSNEKLEVQMIIQEICEKLRSNGCSLLTFRVLCNDIIHILLTEWGEKTAEFESIYNVCALSQCLTINDFHDILWEVCSELMDKTLQQEKKSEDFVTKAVAYMKQNYQNPEFNMSFLAEYLGVSSVTLAVKFKNAMEISPSDYLAIMRMEQAKILLRQTNLQIKEISHRVGYEDSRVFMRRFKKYTGMTPGQYRMQKESKL